MRAELQAVQSRGRGAPPRRYFTDMPRRALNPPNDRRQPMIEQGKIELFVQDVNNLSRGGGQFLFERQLISRELRDAEGPRGVAFSPTEDVSVMINE